MTNSTGTARLPIHMLANAVRRWSLTALFAAAGFSLVACGGGGGGGGGGSQATGSVQATVTDEFGVPVGGAQVSVASRNGTTNDSGVATVSSVPTGSNTVSASASGFGTGSASVSVTANQQAAVSVTLERSTEPAAGLFNAELTDDLATTDRQTITFTLQVLVVDNEPGAVTAIETLTSADFTLQACTDSDPGEVECLRGTSSQPDIGYTVVSATPANFGLVPGLAPNPYAATLMIDQSDSIRISDPTNARLFAAKVFMQNLGGNDFGSLSAFAQTTSAATAQIPDEPVTRLSGFVQSDAASGLFADIDALSEQTGGETPLFDAIDMELDFTSANAPAGGGRRQAVVVFTDGDDSICGISATCGVDVSVQKSVDLGVDIFTIGLGPNIDADVLSGLAKGGSGFFLFAENAQQLFPIYRSLGDLLSRALATYTMEWTISATDANAYQAGQTILGTLVIDTGKNTINLPIRIFLTT